MVSKLIAIIIFVGLICLAMAVASDEYGRCYSAQESMGNAVFGSCAGFIGDLSEKCKLCPYLGLDATRNLHTLLWNENLPFERRNAMSITVEQCVGLYEEGYETVIEDGKIVGFFDKDGRYLKL